jgi:ribosome maturation protein Sdo1
VIHRHGAQGFLDAASKGMLESEFGTTKDEEIMKVILENGSVQETAVSLFLNF